MEERLERGGEGAGDNNLPDCYVHHQGGGGGAKSKGQDFSNFLYLHFAVETANFILILVLLSRNRRKRNH